MSNLLKRTQAFFFKAMQEDSWANGNDGQPISQLPGWSRIVFTHPDFPGFVLTDQWGTGENGKPVGAKSITFFDVPAWVMWYGQGFHEKSYDKRDLPFLRGVLMVGYSAGEFYGGRGPKKCARDGLDYCNDFKGDFIKFEGSEYIIDRRNRSPAHLGGHTYGGRFLG